MNPEQYRLRQYCQIPLMTNEEVSQLMKTNIIVILFNLVVDCTDFDHPGSNTIFQSLKDAQGTEKFLLTKHSFNAELIVCHKTIARLANSQSSEGQIFYKKIKFSQLNVLHENIVSKLDFQRPIFETLYLLSFKEMETLSLIPKILNNPDKLKLSQSQIPKQRNYQLFQFCTQYYNDNYTILLQKSQIWQIYIKSQPGYYWLHIEYFSAQLICFLSYLFLIMLIKNYLILKNII